MKQSVYQAVFLFSTNLQRCPDQYNVMFWWQKVLKSVVFAAASPVFDCVKFILHCHLSFVKAKIIVFAYLIIY